MLSDLPAMPRGLREVHHQRPVPPQDEEAVLSDLPAMPRGLREVHPHPHTQEGTADRKSGKSSNFFLLCWFHILLFFASFFFPFLQHTQSWDMT